MNPIDFVIAALCGGIGAMARMAVDAWMTRRNPGPFPWGTLTVNTSGSFLLGLLTGLASGAAVVVATTTASQLASTLFVIGTGLLGGYTTFSTTSFDTVRLARGRRIAAALANAVGGLVVCVVAALAGIILGGAMFGAWLLG